MLKVFISYVKENRQVIERLVAELERRGVSTWLDRKDIKPGQRWAGVIRKGIRDGLFFIACFSAEYHQRDKSYMNEELTIAIEELRQRSTDSSWFIPVKVSPCDIPDRSIGAGETLRDLQWVELYDDWDNGIARILSVILSSQKKPLKPSASPSPDDTGAMPAQNDGVRSQISDYTQLIEEKVAGFIGRQFVFDAFDQFMRENPRGYFFVRGDPGIGKSALSAHLVKTRGYIHHFNIRAEGINRADAFLRNACAQLIDAYKLNYNLLPPQAAQDAGFLKQLLGEVSSKLEPGQRAVLVVDALDEVDNLGLAPSANSLYLPMTVPPGIYVIVTTRKAPLDLRIDCEQGGLDIEQNSAHNLADIRAYVEREAADSPGIRAYIAAQEIDRDLFVKHMIEHSQGNFMYLHYVLPEIKNGAYKDLDLGRLPVGLQNYYEDHWGRMRGRDEEAWFKYRLPVVLALTVVKEAVSLSLLADFSGVKERARIRKVLSEWAPFLYVEQAEESGEKRYRLYHASFYDFIASREEVADERVSLENARQKIVDRFWENMFDDE